MRRVLTLLIVTTFLSSANAAPLLVNIDNPSFRKLIIAVPEFLVEENSNTPAVKRFAQDGREELVRLLQFSGFFNVVGEDAYSNLMGELKNSLNQSNASIISKDGGKVDGIDVSKWKAIGVESLVVIDVTNVNEEYALTFKVIDILRRERLGGKRISGIIKGEYREAIRIVADRILEMYTGHPGIFQSKITLVGRKSKGANKQVYICDFDGSNLKQITHTEAPHVSPHFSPDGRYVTFTSFENGSAQLFIYDSTSGKKRLLSGSDGLNSGGQWAPNGQLIAFTGSEEGDAEIYTISPEGKNRKKLISGSGLDVDPVFSPDEKWIAFVSGRYGNPHIFLGTVEWDSDKTPKIVDDKRLTYAGWCNATPSWSPDSSTIAFAGYDKDINRWDVFIMNYVGTKMERLTLQTGDSESPSWAPNGQMLVFQSNRVGHQNIEGDHHLYIMNRDGSSQRRLDTGLYEEQTPSWSTK